MNRLFFNANVKSLESGEFEVVASNAKIDRFGDTINPDGWVLANYRKNPVILWSHMAGGFGSEAVPPIARATKVWVEDGQLKVKGVFAPTPFAQELRTLVENGFLNAVSVGFMPLVEDEKGDMEIDHKMYRRASEEEMKDFTEKGIMEKGTKFEKQELLEVSWVAVPALPSALVTAREMGLQLITKELETKTVEPASKEKTTYECECIDCGHKMTTGKHCKDIKCPKCGGEMRRTERPGPGRSIEIKEGRVISEKNRTLINNCLKQMGVAIDALKVLLEATEPPEKDIAPIDNKGRSQDKAKGGGNPELRLMLLADKAVENALRKMKENKSNRKVEIRILRIASKAVDAVIIKAKAKR